MALEHPSTSKQVPEAAQTRAGWLSLCAVVT